MLPMKHDSEAPATEREFSEFLLRVCHDIRAGLRSIQPHSELLLSHGEGVSAADLRECLGLIVEGAQRLDSLADGLASYAIAMQIDRRAFKETSIEGVLRRALASLDRELQDSHVHVSYDRLPPAPGDPDRLSQVFEILIRNCLLRLGEQDTHIHVGAESQPEALLYWVRDDGQGLDAAYLERMFQPFERLDSRAIIGPGLGLATCRIILERHGGRIWAESQGIGSTFWFTLPRA